MNFEDALQIYRNRDSARFEAASEAVIDRTRRSPLTISEIAELTRSLAESGDQIELNPMDAPFVDVPSTGGPGSLSTLLCPLLISSQGIRVPKISASGSIAGAIDTMALVPGFRCRLSHSEFLDALEVCGFAHSEQNPSMCPADKVLIAQRRKAGLMVSPQLAAASLLAKKLIVRGTSAIYDFRVGSTGNVGTKIEDAREAARLFYEVSKKFYLTVKCILTDNRTFPSTALGRMESLKLLLDMVSNAKLLPLDQVHLMTCVRLAAFACNLACSNINSDQYFARIIQSLQNGSVRGQLERHLSAQGGKMSDLQEVVDSGNQRSVFQIQAPSSGFWIPPRLEVARDKIKNAQKAIREIRSLDDIKVDECVGLRLLANPGEQVQSGQPVVEIRFPSNRPIDTDGLAGSIMTYWTPFDLEVVAVDSP